MCKDREYVKKTEDAMLSSDLLVFTTPVYVFHATGALKSMLDHFGYRWMPHRPAKQMFFKRAVIITQCLGAGEKSAAKDIKDSLSWWGISNIKTVGFKLLGDVQWDKLSNKKKSKMAFKLNGVARSLLKKSDKKPRVKLSVKIKFYAVRALKRHLSKRYPGSADLKYWNANGWTKNATPWR